MGASSTVERSGGAARPPAGASVGSLLAAHPTLAFVARRVGAGLITLLVASILIYATVLVVPGNVAQVVLGRDATPQRLAVAESQLHLHESVPRRYVDWLGGLVSGHLGNSMAALAQGERVPVAHEIGVPLRNSLILAAATLLIFIPLCLLLGTAAGLRAGSKSDHAISVVLLAIGSLPEFLVGTLLIVIFFSELHLLPAVSTLSAGQTPLSRPSELVLPVLTLLGVTTAFGTRLLRASIVEVMREDYVAMARLNGIRERRVVVRFALRNALAPSIQVVAQVAQYLVGGIIIVEAVFNYPGIGTTLVQAVQVRDAQVVSVVAILLATVYIVVNIAADLAVVLLVPRLRTQL